MIQSSRVRRGTENFALFSAKKAAEIRRYWRGYRALYTAFRPEASGRQARTEEVWIKNLAAIVTVSDDGGSSGRLRDELQMLPPGDIRNCMIAFGRLNTNLPFLSIGFVETGLWVATVSAISFLRL